MIEKITLMNIIFCIVGIWIIGVFVQFSMLEFDINKECREKYGIIAGFLWCPRLSVDHFPVTNFIKSLAWPVNFTNYLLSE